VPTPTPSSVTFVGAGDLAGSETSNQIVNIPGTVFTIGDNAYQDGSPSDFASSYAPTWGQFKSRTHPVPGNHDYHQTNASGYRGYFGYPATGPLYYSYDLGAWHVIALDSGNCDTTPAMCAAGSAQEAWLKADLASHSQSCVLAYWHHPRFTSGSTHVPDLNVQAFWNDLYAANADLIVNGHNHQYERFAPMNASGAADATRGIREFVVGTGGSGLYGFGTVQPNSQIRYNASHGVIKLTLRAGGYDWSFLPSTGSFTDTGTGSCH
jgi:hypothetical protein